MVRSGYRLGVDIGGTFTDGILIEEETGRIWTDKVSTTPQDSSDGFIQVARRLRAQSRISPEEFSYIIHATTVATNSIIERRGARVGLLVTRGFRDILEIGRQVRSELYNLQTDKTPPLVPRELSFEVSERVNYKGDVLEPLDEQSVAMAANRLRQAHVDSVAVCLLHAYQNPNHEKRVAEIVHELLPDVRISLSSEIAAEIREYWRASTSVVNAYIAPVVSRYLDQVEQKLKADGAVVPLHLMQSSGGIILAESAKRRPVALVESGPAAGVAAAAHFVASLGYHNAISFDMGGTTAKMGLIRDGKPRVLSEFEVGAGSWSGSGVTKGSGYPILEAVLDLVEVGAGGGSIAWIDSGGVMRVGPRSAGAVPGPACYGTGGDRPTITDANLVLGRIDPDYFLGGEMALDPEAAHRAIEEHCARPLAMEVPRAAIGVVDIANATMQQAVRLVSVQRGYDPRDFALVAFGGAGPLHANALADELGIPVIIVPPSPGVASAWGMLVSNLRHDYRQTRLQGLASADFREINDIFAHFAANAREALLQEGVDANKIELNRYLDMRYKGQYFKLRIEVSADELGPDGVAKLKEGFDNLHEQSYGYSVRNEPVEIVNIGLSAVGTIPPTNLREVGSGTNMPTRALKSRRPVFLSELGGYVDCPIYDRYALLQGNIITGPAVIEEVDSTTLVYPHYVAEVQRFGTLVVQKSNPK